MREQAVNFGAAQNLSGVLCEADQPVKGAPVALFWNVGIHHHVGAYRVWVDLARKLADAGFSSLRFDLSGMGDSEQRHGTLEDTERAADLDEAMAFVTKRTGHTTFVPMGFCSGVDQLHALGLRDPRVVAMGYIEAYAWKTRGYYARYPLKFLRASRWRDRLERLSKRSFLESLFKQAEVLALDPKEAEEAGGASMFARHTPDQQQFSADLRALQSRRVKMFFAYFGMDTDVKHAGQFTEMTGLVPDEDLRVFYLGGADHILFRTADRLQTLEAITAWLRQSYPRT